MHSRLAQVRSRRNRKAREHQADVVILFNIRAVIRRVVFVIHVECPAGAHFVLNNVLVHLDDHAKQTVPAILVPDNLSFLSWPVSHTMAVALSTSPCDSL